MKEIFRDEHWVKDEQYSLHSILLEIHTVHSDVREEDIKAIIDLLHQREIIISRMSYKKIK